MLNEIHEGSNKGGNANHLGGCLTSLLIMMTVPIGIIIGVIVYCKIKLPKYVDRIMGNEIRLLGFGD